MSVAVQKPHSSTPCFTPCFTSVCVFAGFIHRAAAGGPPRRFIAPLQARPVAHTMMTPLSILLLLPALKAPMTTRLARSAHGVSPTEQPPVHRAAFVRTALGLTLGAVVAAPGARAESVASIPTSGVIFKDTLNIESFDDPKVQGVKLYIADFQRPINERLASNFL